MTTMTMAADDDGTMSAKIKTCFAFHPAQSAARPSTSTLTCRSQA